MSKLFVTEIAESTAKLARSREDFNDMHKPRGNCPNCGNSFRTPKDTKVSWFWLGYMAGQSSIIVAQRFKKRKWRRKKEKIDVSSYVRKGLPCLICFHKKPCSCDCCT